MLKRSRLGKGHNKENWKDSNALSMGAVTLNHMHQETQNLQGLQQVKL
jgi:hypothetical protein